MLQVEDRILLRPILQLAERQMAVQIKGAILKACVVVSLVSRLQIGSPPLPDSLCYLKMAEK